MKILHTNFHKGWGGQSNRILAVCRHLQKRHDVTIAAPSQSELINRAREHGIKTFDNVRFRRGFRPASIWRDIKAIRNLIRKEKYDIVHTHGSQDSWAAALARHWLKNRPVMLRTKHNIFPIRDHLANRWLYTAATDELVCISHAILEYCAQKPYLKESRLHLIHSAVNTLKYGNGKKGKLKKELGLEGRYIAGIMGRLRPEKGHRLLFDALFEIKEKIPDLNLLVVGTGSLYQELKEYSGSLKMEDRIIFLGFREDIPDVLASLDLFIMPSLSEGLGTAALEAAAAGLPIIASKVGGLPDIVENGKTGILVPPGSSRALAESIKTLYKHRKLARAYALSAREYVQNNFTEEILGEKTEALYQKILARQNTSDPS